MGKTYNEEPTDDIIMDEVASMEEIQLDSDGRYLVSFNQNRSFELFIGRKCFCFTPYSSEELSEEEINHPDFVQQSGYFSVKKI